MHEHTTRTMDNASEATTLTEGDDVMRILEGVERQFEQFRQIQAERTHEVEDHLDQVFIFKRNLEIDFPDPDELREEIRKTVVHEIAHHFGMTDDEMGDYA